MPRSYYQWNDWLFDAIFALTDDPTPVRRVIIDDGIFARAAVGGDSSGIEPKDEFLVGMRRELREHTFQSLLAGELRKPHTTLRRPPFFSLVLFACMAVSEGVEDAPTEAAFGKALDDLCKNGLSNTGHGLNAAWERIAAWLDDIGAPGRFMGMDAEGKLFRRLEIPATPGYAQIGYTIKLAFPRRRDFELLRGALSDFAPESVPTVQQVLDALRAVPGFGGRFRGALKEFEGLFHQNPKLVVASDPFWNIVQKAKQAAGNGEANGAEASVCILAELDDDGALCPVIASKTWVAFRDGQNVVPLDAELPEPWTHLLAKGASDHSDDSDAVGDLVGSILSHPDAFSDSPLAPIAELSRRGRIFFTKSEELVGLWQGSGRPRATGAAVALARTEEAERIARAWATQAQQSQFDGWRVVIRPAEAVAPVIDALEAPRIKFESAVDVSPGKFLGIPGAMPAVSVANASAVRVVRRHGSVHELTRERNGTWGIPRVPIAGSVTFIGITEAGEITRSAEFTTRVASTPEKAIREPGRWFGECGGRNSGDLNLGSEVGIVGTDGRRPADFTGSADQKPLALDALLDTEFGIGPKVGEFIQGDGTGCDWALISLPRGRLALKCLASDAAYWPKEERVGNNRSEKRWKEIFRNGAYALLDGSAPAGLVEAYAAAAKVRGLPAGPRPWAGFSDPPGETADSTYRSRVTREAVYAEAAIACVLRNRGSGIPEGELIDLFVRVFGLSSGRDAWPLLRSWVEAGKFDLLHTFRYRGRRAFGLRPRFVVHNLGRRVVGISLGLLAGAARLRIKNAARELDATGLSVSNGWTASPVVTPPLIVEADDMESIRRLSQASGILAEPCALSGVDQWLPESQSAAELPHRPEGHTVSRYFDPEDLTSSTTRPTKSVVISQWKREQKPSFYVVETSTGSHTWTYSRETAFRRAFAALGATPFARKGPVIEASTREAHLPLAVTRLGVLTSGTSPGPVTDPGIEYRNVFGSSSIASTALAASVRT
ncbi:hypothetical protein [Anaeromyxobacter oryzae]|uniref:Uncharacterized protein n=1 Tax=Anaeromyxobacter oryzae TaxID=2918170 RepID=A0ABM7WTL4_9BACT|nr:hypothetical protein [Anaeromyxobacter oryzae]BDG02833.1 hypothetical protein AMOR_18290 [Anaeromyxobacter oryzae]